MVTMLITEATSLRELEVELRRRKLTLQVSILATGAVGLWAATVCSCDSATAGICGSGAAPRLSRAISQALDMHRALLLKHGVAVEPIEYIDLGGEGG